MQGDYALWAIPLFAGAIILYEVVAVWRKGDKTSTISEAFWHAAGRRWYATIILIFSLGFLTCHLVGATPPWQA